MAPSGLAYLIIWLNLYVGSYLESIMASPVGTSESTKLASFLILWILLDYPFIVFATNMRFTLFTGCFAVFSGSRKKRPQSLPSIIGFWNGTYALIIGSSAGWRAC